MSWCIVQENLEGGDTQPRLSRVEDVPDGAGTLGVGGDFKKTCEQLYEIRADVEAETRGEGMGFCTRCGAFDDGHKTFCRVPEEESKATIAEAVKA